MPAIQFFLKKTLEVDFGMWAMLRTFFVACALLQNTFISFLILGQEFFFRKLCRIRELKLTSTLMLHHLPHQNFTACIPSRYTTTHRTKILQHVTPPPSPTKISQHAFHHPSHYTKIHIYTTKPNRATQR